MSKREKAVRRAACGVRSWENHSDEVTDVPWGEALVERFPNAARRTSHVARVLP